TIDGMKYVIVIPDGCADEPVAELGGRTPLQAARIPNMDRVARLGVVGRSNNVPPSLTPASDVATLSLFAYDPVQVYTGRAPLEIPEKPVADYLPQGTGRDILVSLMEASKTVLADHPVNKRRIAEGKRPATQTWLWGQGKAPRVRSFEELYAKRGAIISAVDL